MEGRGLARLLSTSQVSRAVGLIRAQPRATDVCPALSSQLHASSQLHPVFPHITRSSRKIVSKRLYSTKTTPGAESETQASEGRPQRSAPSALSRLSQSISQGKPSRNSQRSTDANDPLQKPVSQTSGPSYVSNEFHLYVYSHKHNTHVTLTEPQQEDPNKPGRRRQHILMSLSTGNLGFRKSARGTYDAAYQLGAYVMSRIQNDGLLARIHRLELVYRGFGQGREAMTKIILGLEGTIIRDRIVRVVDATRVKMGGQRAPKPRRLG